MRDITLRMAVTCSLVLFAFQVVAKAQTTPNNAPLIKTSIAIDSAILARDKPAIVTITVENISGKELEIRTRCAFELKNLSKESLGRKHIIVGDRYWSPVNISTSTPTELTIIDPEKQKQGVVVGRVPQVPLRFAKGETKTFKMDLTTTFWNDSLSSMWPHETIFKVVPKGSYSLSFELPHQGVKVESNEIEVSVK